MSRLFRSLLDLLFPRTCCGCGRVLALDEQLVCPACLRGIGREKLHDWQCNPYFARLDAHEALVRVGAFAVYVRGSIAARLVQRLKYGRHYELGVWMGMWAARALQPTGLFEGVDALVPLPLTRRRQRWRGFNQSEMIAEGMARVLGLPVRTDILRRTLDRESQTHFHAERRRTNAARVFEATGTDVHGQHLMLVDDVMTTGTTMLGAIRALEGNADTRLSVFVFAWTPLS